MRRKLILVWQIVLFTMVFGLMFPQKVFAEGNDQPRVMITDYELEDGGITPGKTNQLTVTLKNMNKDYTVYSVLVTFYINSKAVYTEYGQSNQVYVDSIAPNAERQIVIPLEVSDTLDSQNIQGTFDISYKDDVIGSSSTEVNIYLPIKQEYLKIQRTYVPQTAVVGVKSRVSVTFKNVSNEEVYNAYMIVTGDGMEETKMQLGTVLKQSMKNQEAYIIFNAIGEQDISIEFTYEDPKGNSYISEPQKYKVDVQDKTSDSQEQAITVENSTGFSLTIKQEGYILALLLCIIISFVIIFKRKKR